MKNVPMRYRGYTLHHNPATLKIEHFGNIRELKSPCCEPENTHLGNSLRRITGDGELYGADCIEQFRELQKLYDAGEAGLLLLPHMPAINAYLKELQMTAQPKDNVLGYRFVFVEAQKPARDENVIRYYQTQVDCESLWDISYKYHVPIDTLVRLNPHIKVIDMLDAEVNVRLC